ncbi:MAG: Ca-activated chloride channel family protein [Candidatus Marinamargulisbacteria bacterium]|jgi:Ca-activated chloride channel family protein
MLNRIGFIWIVMCWVFGIGHSVESATISEFRLNKKGIEKYNEKFSEDAIQAFSEALSKTGQQGEIHFNLGDVFFQEKDYDRAEASFQESLHLLPDEKKSEVYYNLGNVAFARGDLKNAKGLYQESLLLDAGDVDAKINLELVLRQIEQQPTQNQQDESEDKKKDKDEDQDKDKKDQPRNDNDKNEEEKDQKPTKSPQEEEKEQRKENADRILNAMDQKEKEAKQRYRKETAIQIEVEKDW